MLKNFKLTLFFTFLFFTIAVKAQDWKFVTHFPDSNIVGNNNRIYQYKDKTYIVFDNTDNVGISTQHTTDFGSFYNPSFGVSTNGKDFKNLGRYDKNFIETKSVYKGSFLIRDYGSPWYLLNEKLEKIDLFNDHNQNDNNFLTVINDTLFLFRYGQIYDQFGMTGSYDSLFYFNDTKQDFTFSGYSHFYEEHIPQTTLISDHGQLIIQRDSTIETFKGISGPTIVPYKGTIPFYNSAHSSWPGDPLTYDSPFFFLGNYLVSRITPSGIVSNSTPTFTVTNLSTFVTHFMNQPIGFDSLNMFIGSAITNNLLQELPDSSWLLLIRNYDTNDNLYKITHFRSTDNGNTWSLFNSKAIDGSQGIVINKIYAVGNRWYNIEGDYIEEKGIGTKFVNASRFWYSDDKGITWHNTSITGFRSTKKFEIKDKIFLLNNEYLSKDLGNTWNHVSTTMPNDPIGSIRWVDKSLGWVTQGMRKDPDYNYYNFVHSFVNTKRDSIVVQGVVGGSYNMDAYGTFCFKKKFYRIESINKPNVGDAYYLIETELHGYPKEKYNFTKNWNFPINYAPKLFTNGDTLFAIHDSDPYDTLLNEQTILWSTDALNWNKVQNNSSTFNYYTFFNDRRDHLFALKAHYNGITNSYDGIDFFKVTSNGFVKIDFSGIDTSVSIQDFISLFYSFKPIVKYANGKTYFYFEKIGKIHLYLSQDNANTWTRINTDNIDGSLVGFGDDENGKLYLATDKGVYQRDEVNVVSGVEVDNFKNTFNKSTIVYPNPSAGNVFINSADQHINIEIYDVSGLLKMVINDYSNNTSISLDELENGMYIAKVNGKGIKLLINK